MPDLPPLSICLVTCKRTREALETIRSTLDKLVYPPELVRWYIADDGSPAEHHNALLNALMERQAYILGHHNERFRDDDSYNCGVGWNKGLGICHQYSDFVLWMEDDWRLDEPLDLAPYARLLQEKENVGIVSFRILSVGADVHTEGHNGIIYLRYLRTTQYAYSGNPLLRHARYILHYGGFAEDRNPGLIELHQDDQYRLDVKNGPEIWRPAMLDQWGAWHHMGEKIWR